MSGRIKIFNEIFNELEAKTSIDRTSLKHMLSETIAEVYGGIGNALILEDGTVSICFKKDNGQFFFKDYNVSQKKAQEILNQLIKKIEGKIKARDIEGYLRKKNNTLVICNNLKESNNKYILKLADQDKNGFLIDYNFHIRKDDLLPNDLINFKKNLIKKDSFKVLIAANKFDKKLIFCRRFCKEVLIDIFETEFKNLNMDLEKNYSYEKLFVTYNVKDSYVGFKMSYMNQPSSYFKKTLVKKVREIIGKNVVIGFKKINEI